MLAFAAEPDGFLFASPHIVLVGPALGLHTARSLDLPPSTKEGRGLRLASADSELDEYKKVGADATCWVSDEALPYHLTDLGYLAVCRVAESCQFAIPAKHICQASLCQMAALRDFAANHRSSPCLPEDEGFIMSHLLGRMCQVNLTCLDIWSHGHRLSERIEQVGFPYHGKFRNGYRQAHTHASKIASEV